MKELTTLTPLAPRTNSAGECVVETDACPGSGAVTLGGGWLVSSGAITIGFVVAAAGDASFAVDAAFFSCRLKRFLYLAASMERGLNGKNGDADNLEFALFTSLLPLLVSPSPSSSEEKSEEEDEMFGKTFPREDEEDDVALDVDAEIDEDVADEDEADPVVVGDDDEDVCPIVGDCGIIVVVTVAGQIDTVCDCGIPTMLVVTVTGTMLVCTVTGQIDTLGLTDTDGCGVDAMCAIGGCAPI